MSEVKLISPLLDGFAMGNPMSEHDGVRCCPAIKENTDKKYIVKIISVPATQAQLDALLLAGAYKDPADALEYFRQVGEGILEEAQLLKTLSRLDGFLPYEGWQMEPITRRRLGYQIYLVGSYKRSLEKHMKSHPFTHLEAINLGLDLCAALSVCREAGALYVALKPANVFVSESKEYRIGDLGFIQLDALRYSALPEKYLSPYTPPELFDPMANMNLTADTYALGMILYQLYNDGRIPFKGKLPPAEGLPSPMNADYELAEIIMKAIDPDPANRWTDPKDMGKALAAYMQRNAINDVPITPHTPLDVNPEDIVAIGKNSVEDTSNESSENAAAEEVQNAPESSAAEETVEETAAPPEEEAAEPAAETSDEEAPAEEPAAIAPADEMVDISVPETVALTEALAEDVPAVLEETTVTEIPAEVSEEAPAHGFSQIIAKADDLIEHEPDVVLPEIQEKSDPFSFVTEDEDDFDEPISQEEPASEESSKEAEGKQPAKHQRKYADPKYKRRKKRFASFLTTAAVLALLGTGSYWYYQNLYLIHINDLILKAEEKSISVTIDATKAEADWLVKCIRPDGKTDVRSASKGTATFSGLAPNTTYTIQVEIDGFHKLAGQTTNVVTTEATTKISNFHALVGPEDGSVVLSFDMEGQEPTDWTVIYTDETGNERRHSFTGHTVTISGLDVGKIYTFQLDTGENIALGGQTSMEYMTSRMILAEDMFITSEDSSEITVHWKAPGDLVVDQWVVKCYNTRGYEQEVTVTEPSATFRGLDSIATYTIDITASGMTQPAQFRISANPLNVTSFTVDDSTPNALNISWKHSGEENTKWQLLYSLTGGPQNVLECNSSSAVIAPKIPGAKYAITLQSTDGTTVFNCVQDYTVAEAIPFNAYNLTTDTLTAKLLKTPERAGWLSEKLEETVYTNTFSSGDGISIALNATDAFQRPGDKLEILYVIRDAYGNILPQLVSQESTHWNRFWNNGNASFAELNLPKTPTASGEYVLELYFNGMTVTKTSFTIQ